MYEVPTPEEYGFEDNETVGIAKPRMDFKEIEPESSWIPVVVAICVILYGLIVCLK